MLTTRFSPSFLAQVNVLTSAVRHVLKHKRGWAARDDALAAAAAESGEGGGDAPADASDEL